MKNVIGFMPSMTQEQEQAIVSRHMSTLGKKGGRRGWEVLSTEQQAQKIKKMVEARLRKMNRGKVK